MFTFEKLIEMDHVASKIRLILLGLLLPLAAAAQDSLSHQVRFGWGDMLFETLTFHPGISAEGRRMHDFGYTGHIFAEYRYQFTKVVGFGVQADFESIFWKETECDPYWQPIGETVPVRNYNLCILPTVQFTYFRKEWVNLYAGLGFGALIAFDNAHKVEAAPAFDLTLLGIWMGKDHWGATLEIGGLNALLDAHKIYMLGSRMVSVSLTYRW